MSFRQALSVGAFLALISWVPAYAQSKPPDLPPGPGAAIVGVACAQCHSVRVVTQLRQGRRAWRDEVYYNILRGAQVSPDDIDTVVTYLETNFGPGAPLPNYGPPVTLPEGSGKQLVSGVCTLCHGVDTTVAARRSSAQWQAIVARMVYLGTPLTPEEQKKVTDYLVANYSQTNPTAAK